MKRIHWAKNDKDNEQTLCGELVGELLAYTDDEVSTGEIETFRAEPSACPDCLAEIA